MTAIRLMPERNCVTCTRQKEWGCTAERVVSNENDVTAEQDKSGVWYGWSNPSHLPMVVDNETSWACPRQDIKRRPREWSQMLLYYGFYKQGHLPQQGAVMDQSAKAMELFRVFDAINGECDAAESERRHAGPRTTQVTARPTRPNL